MEAKTLNINLPTLHKRQLEVANHPARFKVLSAGRRWGKTCLGVLLCLTHALKGHLAWWVAPTYPIALVGWRLLKFLSKQIPDVTTREFDRVITFPGSGTVQVRSADNPDSLRGDGLDFVVLDECAFMKEEAWSEALRPALSDKKGCALFISTPKGRNWFWRAWCEGQDDHELDWISWQFPTATNPHIDPAEIDKARGDLSEAVFKQEYLAAFIQDEGLVFRRILEAATATKQAIAEPHRPYVFGVDWGKLNDFTVISVIDCQEKSQVYQDRFNKIDYAFQLKRLQALADRFNPVQIIAEQNSMGEPLIEQLNRQGLPVQPFITTNATKAVAVEALALAFERGEIKILNDRVLINELQAYEMERLPSGLVRYNAPEGMHDDTVMALALAWQGARLTSSHSDISVGKAAIASQADW
jgi:hypothetical protein